MLLEAQWNLILRLAILQCCDNIKQQLIEYPNKSRKLKFGSAGYVN
jgi:hypothetical protein